MALQTEGTRKQQQENIKILLTIKRALDLILLGNPLMLPLALSAMLPANFWRSRNKQRFGQQWNSVAIKFIHCRRGKERQDGRALFKLMSFN